MRKALPFTVAALLAGASFGQQVIINEDFDALDPGNLVAQTLGTPWTTWSSAPGGTEDTGASNEQAYSGSTSAKFSSTIANGGPTDIMLQLGNRTSGQYLLGWWMYIPSGKGGYFNLQKSITAGQSWGLDVAFRASGTIEVSSNAQVSGTTTYPSNEWFLVGLSINLNSSTGILTVNGNPVCTWITTTANGAGGVGLNQIGAVNFFAYSGGDQSEYYIDDVSFVDVTGVGIAEESAIEATAFPNPTAGAFVVDAAGLSGAALVSVVDLTGRQVLAPHALLRRGAVSRAEVDLSAHPQGVYFVRIQDGARELVRRVTKH